MYKEIKVLVLDVDGTLTDGIYQVDKNGDVTKSFYTRDFDAMTRIMRAGIKILIVTASHDQVIHKQVTRICSHSAEWERWYNERLVISVGASCKGRVVKNFLQARNLEWSSVAYMGDAENDIDCMAQAGVTACPTDAIPQIRDDVTYPSDYYGGKGAVHDFCTYILEQKKKEK